MSFAQVLRPGPERRAALFYLVSMMPLGATVVHSALWFAEKGLSETQIGLVNAAPVLVMICVNLSIGRIADRASDWRQTIVLAALFQGATALLLFLVDGFWGILAVWVLTVTPNTAINPVLDAATMRMTRRNGTSFGTLRALATVGYLAVTGLTGVLIDVFGGGIFVPFYVGLMILKATVAQSLPAFRAPPGAPVPADSGAERLGQVMRPFFVLPLVGFAMIFCTHIILMAFAALLWKQQGLSSTVIGQLIMLGAIAEAAMMFAWHRLGARISPERGMLIAGATAAVRWSLMGLMPGVPALVGLQLLHAITFALGYLSVVAFIARHTRERIAAEAQSFYMVVQQVMTMIALVGFGFLGQRMGFHAYFVAGGMAVVGIGVMLAGLRAPRPAAAQ